ncbi:MAG: phycobilisome protein [Cyanosarcina radialis HA8281-LM2]|jgi:hypothetical protein|nr:phycobilisome protein [Cyanosarcina radialis HA8281-LM2]
MLTQLNRLSLEIDGRYASEKELKPFKSYLDSLELRMSLYKKVQAHADEIIYRTEEKMKAMDRNLFINSAGDFTQTWKKDIVMLLRYAAASMLFNDGDRLREGLLLWHKTIAKSYSFDRTCNTTFKVMPEVISEFFSPEEAALFRPILSVNGVVLG